MNPFSNFPLKRKAISIVLLVVIIFFLYQWYKDEHKVLQPGTNEYFFIHYNDSLDAAQKDSVLTLTGGNITRERRSDTIYIPAPMWISISGDVITLNVDRPK